MENSNFGHIYIMKNSSYHDGLFKIGFTKNSSEVRAKQLFNGKTGVPSPFEVVMTFVVGNYRLAEKNIHKKLKPYRVNHRREFFEIPLKICTMVVMRECEIINAALGLELDNPLINNENKINSQVDEDCFAFEINSDILIIPNIFHSNLNSEQEHRVYLLMLILDEIYSRSLAEWYDGFKKDHNPEKEIKIWEELARTYLKCNRLFDLNPHKQELFYVLLMRTMYSKHEIVSNIKNNKIPINTISKILDFYTMKPIPMLGSLDNDKLIIPIKLSK